MHRATYVRGITSHCAFGRVHCCAVYNTTIIHDLYTVYARRVVMMALDTKMHFCGVKKGILSEGFAYLVIL